LFFFEKWLIMSHYIIIIIPPPPPYIYFLHKCLLCLSSLVIFLKVFSNFSAIILFLEWVIKIDLCNYLLNVGNFKWKIGEFCKMLDSCLREFFLKKWFASKKGDIWKIQKGQISVNGSINELTLDFKKIFWNFTVFSLKKIFNSLYQFRQNSNQIWHEKFLFVILRKSPKKIVILLVIMYFKKIHSEEISFPRRSSQKRLILRNIKQQKHCTYFRKQTSVFRLQHHYTVS